MKFSFQSCIIIFFVSLIGFTACKKLDDEPSRTGTTLISRLYVSFLDYDPNNTSVKNMIIIDPADTTDLSNIYGYVSPAKGGGVVHFDPNAGAIFQSSVIAQDTFITRISFANDIYGTPGNAGSIGYTGFSNVKGLGFYTYSQQNGNSGSVNSPFLLVANGSTARPMLYAISRPEGKVGQKGGAPIIDKQISLGSIVPTSLTLLESNTDNTNNKLVLIGFNSDGTGKGSGFAVYNNLASELIQRANDTIVSAPSFPPIMKVYVEGTDDKTEDKDNIRFNPGSDDMITAGDSLIVLGDVERIKHLREEGCDDYRSLSERVSLHEFTKHYNPQQNHPNSV